VQRVWCDDVTIGSDQSSCLTGQLTKLTNTDEKLNLKAEDFVTPYYIKTFFFTVVVTSSVKPTRQQGTATQGVQLSAQPVLQIFIKCIANCGELMNPSYRLVLSAQCKVCHNMSYTWQLDSSNNKQNSVKRLLPQDTLNGLREPVVNVNKNIFASTSSETYELVLAGPRTSVCSIVMSNGILCEFCVTFHSLILTRANEN